MTISYDFVAALIPSYNEINTVAKSQTMTCAWKSHTMTLKPSLYIKACKRSVPLSTVA